MPVPRFVLATFVAGTLTAGCDGIPRSPVTIAVDTAARFQIIQGWGATAGIGDSDFPQARIAEYRDEILDWVVDSVGINRLRLPIKSGYEHPEDLAPVFFADNSKRRAWVQRWFYIENDNDDPQVADLDGFQFFMIDHVMETVVLPIRDRLAAKGERLYLNLNYVDFGASPFEHRDNPEEFAEFVFVIFQHLVRKYGVVADAIEILEPDNDAYWTAEDVARGFVAAGARLEAAGYRPDFIGPSTITASGALQYLENMMAVPGVERYLTDFAYHRYGETTRDDLERIATVAAEHGLRTSMLEFMHATHADLHEDLTVANVSAWQKFTILNYLTPAEQGGDVSYRDGARFLAQYFRNIHRGAVRVGATSSDDEFQPVAFVNPEGGMVVIIRAQRQGSFSVTGLAPSEYEAVYTTEDGGPTLPVQLVRDEEGAPSGEIHAPGLIVVRTTASGGDS